MDRIKFSGLMKNTFNDFPGNIAATIYTGGCNFMCIYCHNYHLITSPKYSEIEWSEIEEFLEKRKGLLEGICVSGGEPTLYGESLIKLFEKIKNMGYKTKLDTNGTSPEIVKNLVKKKIIDYIAIDVKQVPEKYSLVVGKEIDFAPIKESIDFLISQSEVEYEFRTTVSPDFISIDDIKNILSLIKGAKNYKIQNIVFEPIEEIYKLKKEKYDKNELEIALSGYKKYVDNLQFLNF